MIVSIKKHADKLIGTALMLLAFSEIIRIVLLSMSADIWYDELFSVEFASVPFHEMVSLTSRDVHPPLYYFILKCGLLIGKGASIATVAKLVSVVPFVLLLIYSFTIIRARYGMVTAGLFSFLVISMPGLTEYTTEIRMYSWGLFFVTAALLHGLCMKNKLGHVVPLCLYSIAATYTHYYAALSVFVIYVMLFVGAIRQVRSVKTFKPLAAIVVSGNLILASYVPWISALVSQATAVSGNYWIQPVGIRAFGSAAKYIFLGYFANKTVTLALGGLLFIGVCILLFDGGVKLRKEDEVMTFLVLPVVIVIAIVVSMIIRPIFVNRYMVPALGCFWLFVSIRMEDFYTVATSGEKKSQKAYHLVTFVLLFVIMLVTGIRDFENFRGNEEYRRLEMGKTLAMFEELDDDAVIISNFQHVQALLSYYLNENGKPGDYNGNSKSRYRIYLYKDNPEPLIKETVPGLDVIEDSIDIYNYLEAGKKVLFLGSFNSRQVLLDEWKEDYGISYENKGSYLMERYWFDVFELAPGN